MSNKRVQKTRKTNPSKYTATGIALNKDGKPLIVWNGSVVRNDGPESNPIEHSYNSIEVFSLKTKKQFDEGKRESPSITKNI